MCVMEERSYEISFPFRATKTTKSNVVINKNFLLYIDVANVLCRLAETLIKDNSLLFSFCDVNIINECVIANYPWLIVISFT